MECVSPVEITRRKSPERSAKARYFASGEITALRMGSSGGFAVSRNSATGCKIGLNRRAATHPAPVPISRTLKEERRMRQRRACREAIFGTVRRAVSGLSGFARIVRIAAALVIGAAGSGELEGSDGWTGA